MNSKVSIIVKCAKCNKDFKAREVVDVTAKARVTNETIEEVFLKVTACECGAYNILQVDNKETKKALEEEIKVLAGLSLSRYNPELTKELQEQWKEKEHKLKSKRFWLENKVHNKEVTVFGEKLKLVKSQYTEVISQ